MVENQNLQIELKKANTRVQKLEQRIAFRGKGGSGKYTAELIKAKSDRNTILADISRENHGLDGIDLNIIAKQTEQVEALTESTKELQEKLKIQSLYIDYLTKENLKEFPKIVISKPDFSKIGIRMKEERNLEGALEKARFFFNSAEQKSKNRSPAFRGKYAGQLQQARNHLNLILKDVEHEPIVIDFYQLRAEIEWQKTVLSELKERKIEQEAYLDKQKNDIALFKKHGYIKPEMVIS